MQVTLINSTPRPYETVYIAGKVCRHKDFENEIVPLLSDASSFTKFIETLIKAGHESVLEHVSYTFMIEGISRNTSHQLVRHRMCSFSQYSHRKSDSSIHYIIPDSVQGDLLNTWKKACDTLTNLYVEAAAQGVSWDDARYILPMGITTTLMWTINVRALRNFFKLRLAKSASIEMQELANTVFCLVQNYTPAFFTDLYELFDPGLVKEYSAWNLPTTID